MTFDSLIHPVFHVSQLKPITPSHALVFSALSKTVDLTTGAPQPEEILDRCLVKKGNSAMPQILVKWSTIPAESATWEDYYVLKKCFPSVNIWEPVSSLGEASVTPPPAPRNEGEGGHGMQAGRPSCKRRGLSCKFSFRVD